MIAYLTRIWKDKKQTLGELNVGDLTIYTLELPDLNNDGIDGNEIRKSCIPDGIYKVVRNDSPKFGKTFLIKDVPGRSQVLIHYGNYYSNTLGCILVGMDQMDINKDGLIDNVSSKPALELLLKYNISEIRIKTI